MAEVGFAVYGNYGGRFVGAAYGAGNLTYTESVCGVKIEYEGRDVRPNEIAAQLEAWEAPDGLISRIEAEMMRQGETA